MHSLSMLCRLLQKPQKKLFFYFTQPTCIINSKPQHLLALTKRTFFAFSFHDSKSDYICTFFSPKLIFKTLRFSARERKVIIKVIFTVNLYRKRELSIEQRFKLFLFISCVSAIRPMFYGNLDVIYTSKQKILRHHSEVDLSRQ